MSVITVLKNERSRSARFLTASVRAALRTTGRRYVVSSATAEDNRRTRNRRYVINWGVSEATSLQQRRLIITNSHSAVANCQNKLATFAALTRHNVPCLEFSAQAAGARLWMEQDGKIVVRHTTTGHSGAGIQIVRRGEEIPNAPLYTRYFRKSAEYRVHVAFGNVILIQQKRKRDGFADLEIPNKELVRTHGNGWVFTVNNLDCEVRNYRAELSAIAINGVAAVGCNHGAVDVLVRHEDEGTNAIVICEINSAPSLDAPSTLNAYTEAFVNNILAAEN